MEPKIIGEYYVWDADLLEGWDNEKLAKALEKPLEKLGLIVYRFFCKIILKKSLIQIWYNIQKYDFEFAANLQHYPENNISCMTWLYAGYEDEGLAAPTIPGRAVSIFQR